MDSSREIIVKETTKISSLIGKGKFKSALKKFFNLESEYPQDPYIQFIKVGVFIDSGYGINDEDIIKQGIEEGVNLLKEEYFKDQFASLNYNIANGYMSLYEILRAKYDSINYIDNNDLQKAKYHFREALKYSNLFNFKLMKELWTNYGNCLSTLGRSLEAFQCYENALRIGSEFSMALFNKARVMQFFADISGVYREAIYIDAYQIHKSLIGRSSELTLFAKKALSDEIKRIESLVENKNILNKKIKHNMYSESGLSRFEKFYLDFSSNYNLFLNLHIHADRCEASIKDPVFISLITPLEDDHTFYDLAKYINQIKEDFAVARLLLVQSQFKRKDFNRISQRTSFVYSLDYSIFNIYIGLLKSAFKEAFNILDKITVFINDYYKIGMNPRSIYFDNPRFWQEEDKIKKMYLDSENISLFALYDIFFDFQSGYYRKIKNIRNALTHRRLAIFESDLANLDNTNDSTNIDYNSMFEETISLFKMVKSAIIYLINFVENEERKKWIKSGKKIAPFFVDDYQFLEEDDN